MAKKTAKSPRAEIVKEGIFLFKNSKGIAYRTKENQHILATAQGYNSKQNAIKGLYALRNMLNKHFNEATGKFEGIIDLTKK